MFFGSHRASLVIYLMVVADNVKQTVNEEFRDDIIKAAMLFARLLPRRVDTDNDVA